MRLADYPDPHPKTSPPPLQPGEARAVQGLCDERQEEGRRLLKLGFAKPMVARLMATAESHGTTLQEELLASGAVEETVFFEALAHTLGLPFWREMDPDRVLDSPVLDSQLRRPEMLRVYFSDRPPMTVITPTLTTLARLEARLIAKPGLKPLLAVATPALLRRTAWAAGRTRRLQAATVALFDTLPDHSARVLWRGWQGFLLGLGLAAGFGSLLLAPLLWMLVMHVVLSSVYAVQFALRVLAVRNKRRAACAPVPSAGTALPIYSILVTLHDEAAVIPQLVRSLDRLDWPRARLDIKFVCEADDAATLAALAEQTLGPEYEIVHVPPSLPRTKPKALQYALPGVRGGYVTVYDAEDRPHPRQLQEAHAAFERLPGRVACLQAPLVISNAGQSWLSALFAVEYAGLFRALLPLLARLGGPLPLGGTSNHFKTEVLRHVGGWDPYNLTEDADLGIRLHRLGFCTQVISLPTLEDAPVEASVWLGQRTRWYKGWCQTYIVMMRKPGRLLGELGLPAFLLAQVTVAGLLISALGHPVILAFIGSLIAMMAAGTHHLPNGLSSTLLGIDIVNLVGSYAITVGLGLGVMGAEEKRAVGLKWLAVPAYWLMISAAAWLAVRDLHRRPSAWKKTPHRPTEETEVERVFSTAPPDRADGA